MLWRSSSRTIAFGLLCPRPSLARPTLATARSTHGQTNFGDNLQLADLGRFLSGGTDLGPTLATRVALVDLGHGLADFRWPARFLVGPGRFHPPRDCPPPEAKRAHLRSRLTKTPPKFHKKTPREKKKDTRRSPERKKNENGGREGKTARNFGPPTLRAPIFSGFGPPFGPPSFLGLGHHPFGSPTPSDPTPSGPHQPQSLKSQKLTVGNVGLAVAEIGRAQSRSWPKEKLLGKSGSGQSRSRPHNPLHWALNMRTVERRQQTRL